MGDAPDDRLLDRYVDGIAVEWERERASHGVRRLSTLYLGGGTPSLLGAERLERLLDRFRAHLTAKAEVTVEANPEDVDVPFAAWVAGAGVRVSMGVQSFQAGLRANVGRVSPADPVAAFVRLREAGVRNLSIDLMHGLPGQTPAGLEADIAVASSLRPEHISWYELHVAVGTPLAARLATGSLHDALLPPDADTRAAMYRRVVRALGHQGYDWYEVSNFALPGRRARHNMAYWRARPYLGLGPGAVSTVGALRWTNTPKPDSWRRALSDGRPQQETENLDEVTRGRERLMLAARCGIEVPLSEVGETIDLEAADRLSAVGLVTLRGGTIRVTRKGRYVADEVCVRLFRDRCLTGR